MIDGVALVTDVTFRIPGLSVAGSPLQAQTFGSSHAYLVAGVMILVGSLVTFGFLNVKHESLSSEGHENVHLA